ncbi:MAG: hypothetical protein NW223_15140 [Hyphomicrobiaceae bacterium]|nr:hypothetical protein [Hyphomicrobiaceae bacterium]
MAPAALEIIGLPQRLDTLPFEVEQRTSWSSAATRLALLVPVVLVVLVPVVSVLRSGAAAAQAVAHPGEAMVAGTGLALFLALFGLPAWRAARALGSRRRVTIEGGAVTVEESTPFGQTRWTLPIADFQGLAHVVRTSLSGARHEIMLVHRCRRRQVLLVTAERLSEADIAHAASLLRLPVVAAEHVVLPQLVAPARPPEQSRPATPAMAPALARAA